MCRCLDAPRLVFPEPLEVPSALVRRIDIGECHAICIRDAKVLRETRESVIWSPNASSSLEVLSGVPESDWHSDASARAGFDSLSRLRHPSEPDEPKHLHNVRADVHARDESPQDYC